MTISKRRDDERVDRRTLVIATAAWTVLHCTPAWAAYPEKPIRLVVPFAPGGGTDVIARSLGSLMSKELGQPVIIDNRAGGGTIIGTDAVAKSPPDGYTLVIATFAHAINPSLQSRLPYDTYRDFAPVILIGRGPNVLVVRAESPFKSVGDVISASRANLGALTYASQGIGTSAHLAGEMFSSLTGTKLSHVPYRGAGPALTDLLGGQVDMVFGTAAAVSGFVSTKRMRALGVTTPEPSPELPGIPAIAATVPGYVVESWYGLYAPAGTPREVILRLNAAARNAARSDEFGSKLKSEGIVVTAGPPEELDAYVRGEEARWRKIIQENNVKPE